MKKLERQVEDDYHNELRQSCFREKSYSKFENYNFNYLSKFCKFIYKYIFFVQGEAAIWRARNYGDERMIKKAMDYEMPACERINQVFGAG